MRQSWRVSLLSPNPCEHSLHLPPLADHDIAALLCDFWSEYWPQVSPSQHLLHLWSGECAACFTALGVLVHGGTGLASIYWWVWSGLCICEMSAVVAMTWQTRVPALCTGGQHGAAACRASPSRFCCTKAVGCWRRRQSQKQGLRVFFEISDLCIVVECNRTVTLRKYLVVPFVLDSGCKQARHSWWIAVMGEIHFARVLWYKGVCQNLQL